MSENKYLLIPVEEVVYNLHFNVSQVFSVCPNAKQISLSEKTTKTDSEAAPFNDDYEKNAWAQGVDYGYNKALKDLKNTL
jgi:hypothetical protein